MRRPACLPEPTAGNGRFMAADDRELTPDSATLRLRTTADLGAARERTRELFTAAAIPHDDAELNVLAISELLTNALEATEPGGAVTAVVAVTRSDGGRSTRRIDVDVINTGEPMVGRREIEASAMVHHRRPRGRGLALASQAGSVVVEGLVGGTRARLKSVINVDSVDDPIG